jgi:hypothetical protein
MQAKSSRWFVRRTAAIVLACAVVSAASPTAAAAAEAQGYHAALFNGQDLDGWQVNGCDVAVKDGKMILVAGDGFVRTLDRHGDFVLKFDWRPRRTSGYDSGVYVRAPLPEPGKPWPDRYQVNLKEGREGNIAGLSGAESKGLIKPGDWNHFELTVVGDTAELAINGQKAWKAAGLENADGYIGLQSEVDGGGQFEFRNIELVDLDYRPLFNGRDLAGWTGDTKGYTVEDGSIVCPQRGVGRLFTSDEFGDFSLRLDFKLTPGANNGIGLRTPLEGDPAYVGMESQVLDNSSPRYVNIKPWQAHGSIYGVVPAKTGHLKPVGEWNREEIICRGRHVTVILNGHTIVDADLDEAAKGGTVDGKDHPGLSRTRGHIGFLGHGARVEFRNIRIKDLAGK